MKWYENVLDKKGIEAVKQLAATLDNSFYLAGGTGLALQLGHRISLDLDLFSQERLLEEKERLAIIRKLKNVRIIENSRGTCHLDVGGTSVRLLHYRYPLLEKTMNWRGLSIASLLDISSMKLSAAVGRGSKKDFVDLYQLSRQFGLPKLLKHSAKRFSDHEGFALQCCKALVYFDDAEKEPMPRLFKKISWEDIKAYFETEVPKVLLKNIKP